MLIAAGANVNAQESSWHGHALMMGAFGENRNDKCGH